jgi:eukaryotic-like serine/threonine-protein kinase
LLLLPSLPHNAATPRAPGYSVNCPKCSAPNPNEAVRCQRCGGPLPGAQDGETLQPPSSSHDAMTVSGPHFKLAGGATPEEASRQSDAGTVVAGSSRVAAVASARAPVDFGPRYRVEAMLGEGGMGAVYKAYDIELGRMVALKLVHPELTRDPASYQRFKQELLLASKISHKNILRTHDLGEAGGLKFISMACIEGQDLRQLIVSEGKLPVNRAVHIARQLCAALDAAHSEGVVHRDLKPQNVLVDHEDNIYVSDFGLAKSLESDLGMTHTGQFLGTPRYMSPEQAEAKAVDRRSDLYAFGLILCEMLTADIPFETTTSALQTMLQRVQSNPKNPKTLNPDMPAYLAQIIRKCLERDPERRYQNAREILADLEAGRAPARSMHITLPSRQITLPFGRKAMYVGIPALAAVLVIAALVFRSKFRAAPPRPRGAAVSVLVADFTNYTGDPIFDGTLEPMFNVALEGASFINAYSRSEARKQAEKLPHPTDRLDEQSARLVAVSQGINAVVMGEISRRGDSYSISAIALDGVSGNVIAKGEVTAANKDEVLGTIPKLAATIRRALGDPTSESAQFAAVSGEFNAASLEAVHQDAIGLEQQFAGKYEEALQSFAKAAQFDPNFARAYSGMAAMSENLGRPKDAEKYMKLAMEHVDRMTERERYRNRGLYYASMGDWQKCVEENSQLVSRYPADRVGQLNLAGCYAQLRNIPKAVEAARRAVEIVPRGVLQRLNLSFLSSFGGDFQNGAQEARAALQINPSSEVGYLVLAEAEMGQGRLSQAAETYQKLEKVSPRGASMAAAGLADLAVYEGRFADAVRILEQGASDDLAAKNPESAAEKFAALAHAQLLRGQSRDAVAAADKALARGQSVQVRFLAGRIFAETGEIAKAHKLAAGLGSELQAEPQAYAKIIEGKSALKQGDARQAIKELGEANSLLDTWIGRFELGRAYLEAGRFVEADSEFDRCVKRRGEALELFMDNVPTYGYFPLTYYYQGRVREGLKSPGFADPYRTYLSIRGQAGEDPLLPEIRRRLGQ